MRKREEMHCGECGGSSKTIYSIVKFTSILLWLQTLLLVPSEILEPYFDTSGDDKWITFLWEFSRELEIWNIVVSSWIWFLGVKIIHHSPVFMCKAPVKLKETQGNLQLDLRRH